MGLEQADTSAFYTPAYFLKALRKYMAFLDVPEDLLDEEPDDAFGLRMTLAEMPPRRTAALEGGWSHPWRSAAVSLAVVVLGLGAYRYLPLTVDRANGEAAPVADVEPIPAQPLLVAASAPPSAYARPVSAVLSDLDDESTVRVTVGKATWIFVRYPDNRVVERRLGAGEELEVGPLPVYLAVGIADSVEVRVEDRPVVLDPYIRDGQIRITRPELARLAPGRLAR